MQRQHNEPLVLQVVGSELSDLTIEDEVVSSISVLE